MIQKSMYFNKNVFLFQTGADRMASSIESYVGHTVSVITADGRNIVGTLKGYDQTINIILDESHERVYSQNAGVEQVSTLFNNRNAMNRHL